jgi:uncharacterized membrane protein
MSSDGAFVAGASCASDAECEAYAWTKANGLQRIGVLPGDDYSDAGGANPSRDGKVLVGRSCRLPAWDACRTFIWTEAGGLRPVPTLSGKSDTRVEQVSSDGTVLVGRSCNRQNANWIECEAVRLDVESNTIESLGLLAGYAQSEAKGISADNAVISVQACDETGYSQCQSAIWTASTGLQGIGFLPGDTFSLAWISVSSPGPTATGSSGLGVNSERKPYVWTGANGMRALPRLNTTDRVLWMSTDGSVIVGDTFSTAGQSEAVVWTGPSWNLQPLTLPGDTRSTQRLATDRVVIGESGGGVGPAQYAQPYRWVPGIGLQGLGLLPGMQTAIAVDASSDGSVVAGWQADDTYSTQLAFVWTAATGLEAMDALPGDLYADVVQVSADGNIALGTSCDNSRCDAVTWTRSQPNTVETPTGSDVVVAPVVALPGSSGSATVELTFENIGSPGVTTVTAASSPIDGAPETATGFKTGDPAVYFDVETNASFTGTVGLCFSWQEGQFADETAVALFHYEDGAWVNVTTSVDPNANSVCGRVSSFSPFALFERAYEFSGFFPPVDNYPISNVAKAGSSIPARFSLGGDQGMAIFAAGYPASRSVSCQSGAPPDAITETATSGTSGLAYDASSDQYTYVWKTDKAWAKSCRQLIVKFVDGTVQTAGFEFRK